MHYLLSRSGFYLGYLRGGACNAMHDDLILVCFTSKPRLGAKFFAFPLSMRESYFQLNCAGNSLLLHFTTLQFQYKAWR